MLRIRAVLARAKENGVPIVEANVGVTLIISKGEVVACERRVNAVTVGTIEIPAAPSAANRDRQEERFLQWRAEEMPKRYERASATQRRRRGAGALTPTFIELEVFHTTGARR